MVIRHAAPGPQACGQTRAQVADAPSGARPAPAPSWHTLTVSQHVQLPSHAVLVRVARGVSDPHTLGRRLLGQGPDTLFPQAQRTRQGPSLPPRLCSLPDLTSAQVPRVWKGVTSILVMMLNTLPPWAQKQGTVGRRRAARPPLGPTLGVLGGGGAGPEWRTSGGFTYSSTSHTLFSDEVMPLTLVMTELSGPVSLSW